MTKNVHKKDIIKKHERTLTGKKLYVCIFRQKIFSITTHEDSGQENMYAKRFPILNWGPFPEHICRQEYVYKTVPT